MYPGSQQRYRTGRGLGAFQLTFHSLLLSQYMILGTSVCGRWNSLVSVSWFCFGLGVLLSVLSGLALLFLRTFGILLYAKRVFFSTHHLCVQLRALSFCSLFFSVSLFLCSLFLMLSIAFHCFLLLFIDILSVDFINIFLVLSDIFS